MDSPRKTNLKNVLLNVHFSYFSQFFTPAYQKAFDTVDHYILLTKYDVIGMGPSSLNRMRSYLTGRFQHCAINESRSNHKAINCGVGTSRTSITNNMILYADDAAYWPPLNNS